MTTFSFDGRAIPFAPGQTIGAALVASGIYSWRTTRFAAAPRGLFCGIGVCYDCLLRVGAVPNLRACQTPATAGAAVSSQLGTGRDDLAV